MGQRAAGCNPRRRQAARNMPDRASRRRLCPPAFTLFHTTLPCRPRPRSGHAMNCRSGVVRRWCGLVSTMNCATSTRADSTNRGGMPPMVSGWTWSGGLWACRAWKAGPSGWSLSPAYGAGKPLIYLACPAVPKFLGCDAGLPAGYFFRGSAKNRASARSKIIARICSASSTILRRWQKALKNTPRLASGPWRDNPGSSRRCPR